MSWSATDVVFRLLNALGCILLYAALFLHPDEEGQIQNRVEEWWIRVSDEQKTSRSRVATFMREVAKLTAGGFDCLFGKRLISFRVGAISVCFSIASLFLFGFFAVLLTHKGQPHLARNAFLWCCVFSVLGAMPALFEDGWLLKLWWAAVIIILLPLTYILAFVYFSRGPIAALRGTSYLLLFYPTVFEYTIGTT